MSMLVLNKKIMGIKNNLLSFLIIVLVGVSCKKDPTYVYNVNTVNVSQNSSLKRNVKTTNEFVSIAYSDLYSSTINNDKLTKLSTAYLAFGDKKLIEEIIIKNFLNDPSVKIISKNTMKANVEDFVIKSYKKFYNREPNEFELWNTKNIINADTSITPELMYYSFMTSNEYRYY